MDFSLLFPTYREDSEKVCLLQVIIQQFLVLNFLIYPAGRISGATLFERLTFRNYCDLNLIHPKTCHELKF